MHSSLLTAYLVGSGPLARACAEHLLAQGHPVLGILTADRALADWAGQAGLSVHDWSEPTRPFEVPSHDYLFNIVNCRMIPEAVRRATRLAAVNYHDSPLPALAGYYATTWAIADGATTHGVTWHLLEGPIDSGGVLAQREVPIEPDDTAVTLNARCFEASVSSFHDLVAGLRGGGPRAIPQDLSRRTFNALQTRPSGGGLVDWGWPAALLDRHVRSLSFGPTGNPVAAPKTLGPDGLLLLDELTVTDRASTAEPGTVTAIHGGRLTVATADFDVRVALRPARGAADSAGADDTADTAAALPPGTRLPALAEADRRALRELCQRAAPAERRWTASLARLLARRPVGDPPARRRSRPTGERFTLDTQLRADLAARGWSPAAAVAAAYQDVVTASGHSPAELWWSNDRLRHLAGLGRGLLTDMLCAAPEAEVAGTVGAAIEGVTRLIHRHTALGPYPVDLVDRTPALRRIAARGSSDNPLLAFGLTSAQAAGLAAGRRLALVADPGETSYTWWTDPTELTAQDTRLLGERMLSWLRGAVVVGGGGVVGGLSVLGVGDVGLVARVNGSVGGFGFRGLAGVVAGWGVVAGGSVAVCGVGGVLSFGELDVRAGLVAAGLVAAGVGRGMWWGCGGAGG
ncbi:hypothetical protein E6W39_00200 [Kitasatospora acidiphila]|uniref:phosphoribosylglycinamide formyltransferase 1 n=1 Tax=Kitasatospora acidiphila TaxID=2567942 RepID=A0A540WGE1_9ACTN|nr:formyltransferase family protein [Kitasatospora acidiphila]TQF08018.1 hypothetical protein E6W39_00200 [Kitasatospora acidiphila]